ncbi:hypothetical protein DYB26_006813 [Aphanomyces astaci]|uniref:Cullin N-terminal domain-containing protein n=2 Tax=Aphanomyces astaci TaxID=112090 RepID=A0A3R7B5E8_APHAT|nr:hypothetical protein DYB26_006813 [Aphanomyces astaci]
MKKARKIVIKPFKQAPSVPEGFEEKAWKSLEVSLLCLQNKSESAAVSLGWEELYGLVTDLCHQKKAAWLYELLQKHLAAYVERTLKSACEEHGILLMESAVFVERLVGIWEEYCSDLLMIRNLCLYLDRTYVIQTSNVASIYDMGVGCFQATIQTLPPLEAKVTSSFLQEVERERYGETVQRNHLKSLVRMATALHMYTKHVERPFLAASEVFYAQEGQQLLESASVGSFLLHVEKRLAEEHSRVTSVLDGNVITKKGIVQPSLSAVDVRMILDSLHVAEFPLQMGSFNELVSLVLGIEYGDPTADPFALVSHDHAEMLADNILLTSSIRHPNMVVPMLELIQKCHLHVRWVGLECFKLLLSDDNVEGALNRRVFLACYATQGYAPYPVEVFFASFVTDAPQLPASDNSFAEAFSSVSTTGIVLSSEIYITIYLGLRDVPILRLRELMANVDLADDARLGAAMSLLLLGDHQSLFDLLSNDSAKCDQYRRYKQLAKDNTLLSNRFKTGMRMLLSSIARSRTQEHVVATCMDVMAHMIVVDMKTNEAAYELVLHPFKLVPNQPHVVMTWLKVLVDRLGALVDSHMPPKGSLCWRNLDNICSIATSVVLHFDPWASVTTTACGRESLVDEDDGRTAAAVFWKAKDEYAKERELSDAILNVWHKCASSLSCDVDASFGRTAQPRLSLSSSQVPVATRSSPSTGAAAKRNSIKDQSQPPTIAPSSLRQFPGGAMRQILALILRSMYMAIKDQDMFLHSHGEYNEEDEEDEDEDESPAPRRRSRVNSTVALDAVFAAKLAKLDYFVELLQLNQQNYVPAKEDASLVHWLALELRHLMEEAGRLSFVSRVLLQNTPNVVTSVDHVRALLDRQEFELTDTEVGRRDLFYHEYLETCQEIRHKKKSHVLAVVEYERECAKQAVDVVLASGIQVRPSTDPVWLQRVHAKDVDDWMKLERVLRWNIRHVWSVDSLSQATKWQLDSFTSSKWMRCRLLPDVDKVHPYKKLAKTINNSLYDALVNDTLASTPAILVLPPSADDDLDDDIQHTLDVDDDRVHVVMGRSTDDDLDDMVDMVDMAREM